MPAEGDPQQPVRNARRLQTVPRGGVVLLGSSIQSRRDLSPEVDQLGLRDRLHREAGPRSQLKALQQHRTVHIGVDQQRLGVIRVGRGGRRGQTAGKLHTAYAPSRAELVEVRQAGLQQDDPLLAAERPALGQAP